MTKKSKSLHINFPEGFIKIMDKWAEETKRNRSEFIREAVRHFIITLREKGEIL